MGSIPLTRRVLEVFNSASVSEIREGMAWYKNAHELATELDPENPSRAAGVIAALSPITSWDRNVWLARMTYKHNGLFGGTLQGSWQSANRILTGTEPLDVLNGPKVRAFYTLIADPNSTAVCIDRHAASIAMGKRLNGHQLSSVSRNYLRYVRCYERAAKELSTETVVILPNQVQAVTWVHWRNTKGDSNV